jgi:hypothetical protein
MEASKEAGAQGRLGAAADGDEPVRAVRQPGGLQDAQVQRAGPPPGLRRAARRLRHRRAHHAGHQRPRGEAPAARPGKGSGLAGDAARRGDSATDAINRYGVP